MRSPPSIIEANSVSEIELARAIFAEYGASIADAAGCSLQHQNFDAELAALPGKYAPPKGAILLAFAGEPGAVEAPVGCIALRPLEALGPGVCEMKRMYVRPAARGKGVGRLLCDAVLARAKSAGYTDMKLDTDASFAPAIALYESMGFARCERYNDDPMDDTLWFEKHL